MNNFSTKPTRTILDRLKSPDKKLKIIHIAGTNGKGSTAEFFTEILIAAGKKVGTFTSPEVYAYNDQFRINGKPLSDKQIEKYFGAARKVSDGVNPSDFEVETAGAIYAFAEEGCEWAVIECGMGGLTDATNAVSHKELAVITSVSLEHTEFLGNTIEEICRQKAGIIINCPSVVNSRQTEEAINYFKNLGAAVADKSLSDNFCINAEGSLQPYNAATAIAGARILGIDESAIYAGVKNAEPEGRLEIINKRGRTYILDGAHNPAAFEPLRELLSGNGGKSGKSGKSGIGGNTTIIFGCLSDKDIEGNLRELQGLAEEIIAVECPSPRAMDLQKTLLSCGKYFEKVKSAKSVTKALDIAKNNSNVQTVVVCGSFTLLKGAKQWIENLTEKKR